MADEQNSNAEWINGVMLQLKEIEDTLRIERDQFCVEAAKSAAARGLWEEVKVLVQTVGEKNVRDQCCNEISKSAASEGQWEEVKLLLQTVGDHTVRDQCCKEIAQSAASEGQWEEVKVLLQTIGDHTVRDQCFKEAAKSAANARQLEEANFLVQSIVDRSLREQCASEVANSARERYIGSSSERPYLEKWSEIQLIGRGGYGEVHEVCTDMGITCAAKTLRVPFQLGDQLESLIDEAIESEKNLCRLSHDNIVKFLYIGQPTPAKVVVFMELLDGCSLERFMKKNPLEEAIMKEFVLQICSALVYMHSQEEPVIHRDIKCSNIIVLADEKQIKLIDFGLSIKLEQSISHITASSKNPKGTLHYMAPELLASEDSSNPKYSRGSDIWAFGCSVYEMASGKPPFTEHHWSRLPELLKSKGAPFLPDSCSPELHDFYRCCTKRDRRERKSAEELEGHEFLYAAEWCEISPFVERWDSLRLIGRGGFGEVHEVLTDKGISCAAKTIKMLVQLGDLRDSAIREIDSAVESERNLYRLHHVNIVRFLYIYQPEPATVVVFMELLDGCSLEEFLDGQPLNELTVRDFSKQICSALVYMHSRRPPVIHRDINCNNVMLLADKRRLKLIDFGLSIKLEQSVSHISASNPMGTLNFMAPELLGAGESDSIQCSRKSDIWAFGCTVFQMVSGARPFAKTVNIFQVANLFITRGAPALPDGSSTELKDFYSRCTAKERTERKSAAELMGHEFLTGNGSSVHESAT